jgi:hypothetical protein
LVFELGGKTYQVSHILIHINSTQPMPSTPTPTPTPTPTTQALVGLVDGPRGPLLRTLEDLWFLYLDAWRAQGRYPIGYCFLGGTYVVMD